MIYLSYVHVLWGTEREPMSEMGLFLVNIYLLNVNNGNTRKKREIYSRLTILHKFYSKTIMDFCHHNGRGKRD